MNALEKEIKDPIKRDEFKLIYRGIYKYLYFHPVHKIMIQEWTARNAEMDEDMYKAQSELLAEMVEQYQAKYLLVNNALRVYRLTPELQEWYMLRIVTRFKAVGLQKVAIAANTDLLLHISIEELAQLIENKREDILIEHRFFERESDALKWLTSEISPV